MDLDVVGDVLDGDGVGGGEVGLLADARGHDALQEELGVDDGDAAEG